MPGLDFWTQPTVILSLAAVVISLSGLVVSVVSSVRRHLKTYRPWPGDDV